MEVKMGSINEAAYKEIGVQLSTIRKLTGMTLDAISKATKISRSYISDFERGLKLPTSKYLKYLHDKHNVNLNFIFCSEGNNLRLTSDEKVPDFGKYQEEVDEILHFIYEIPHALFSIIAFFSEYKINNKDLIDRYYVQKGKKS